MIIARKQTLKFDDVIVLLCENERMRGKESASNGGESALAFEGSNRGRSTGRCDGYQGRSKSRVRDDSEKKCYYCGEKGHIQFRCSQMCDDLKSIRQMKLQENGKKTDSSVVVCDEDVVLLMQSTSTDASNTWVLDSAASMHVCNNKNYFDTLKTWKQRENES